MVRLLLCLSSTSEYSRNSFQSHNGAIAARMPQFRSRSSMMVSIPQWCDCCNSPQTNGGFRLVSIPQWCDCCQYLRIEDAERIEVSIPQWCDCCRDGRVLQDSYRSLVSIPQWCDCCSKGKWETVCKRLVSIPQWCDCCLCLQRVTILLPQFQSHNGAIAA